VIQAGSVLFFFSGYLLLFTFCFLFYMLTFHNYLFVEPLVLNRQADGMPEETMHGQGNNKHLSREEEEDDGGRTSCQLYSYQVLEAATCHFSSRNKLGSGGFGTVYKVTVTKNMFIINSSLLLEKA